MNPNAIYYRPLYVLPDFATICNNWQALNTDAGITKYFGPVNISLLDAQDRKWAELGHKRLDDAKAQVLTAAQVELIKRLSISLRFVGKPAVLDVYRGDWDVNNMRDKGWHMAKTLPAALRRPFCKTVKMMFAWSIEMTIKLLPGDGSPLAALGAPLSQAPPAQVTDDIRDFNTVFLRLGFVADKSTAQELHLVSGEAPYPILLATLARLV